MWNITGPPHLVSHFHFSRIIQKKKKNKKDYRSNFEIRGEQ